MKKSGFYIFAFWLLSYGWALLLACGPLVASADFSSSLAAVDPTIASTTGWSALGVMTWAGPNFFELLVGTAVGIVLGFRWWLAAAGIIAAIVFFAKRAFLLFLLP